MSQIDFGDPPEYDLTKPHICLVKIIKQMQPGEENAPSIDCSGNYEAARAELGQGGKIHGAFSCFLMIRFTSLGSTVAKEYTRGQI